MNATALIPAAFMQRKILITVTTLLGLVSFWHEMATAAPMRCSGEQKTCIANCNKTPDRSTIAICVTNCGTRQSMCMKTGCWDSGFQKYCGLLKQ